MKVFGCVLFLCNLKFLNNFVNCGVVPNDDLFRLDIVHYNDFHDRFEETSVPYPVCRTNDSSCLGGFSRLYQEINTLLKEKPGALLLNAGDAFQGTYWYTLLKWNVTQKFINMLPNDVHAIGNHEFDSGIAGLAPYLAALQAPVVAANMDTTKEPSLNGLFMPHVILERKGRKIGIIGLITPETKISSNAENVVFLDPIKTVQKEAEILVMEGIDIIIVLSHCGLDVDKAMAEQVGEHIDIIVGGHSHSLLWNGVSPSGEKVEGPYPVIVETQSKPEHKVLIVQASAFTKYLGNLTTYFDKNGDLQSFDAEPVFLNRSIPEDPEMTALLEPYKISLHNLVKEVVGYTEDDMIAFNCGAEECAIGDFTADAFAYGAKELNVSTLPHIGFLTRNMIRGSIGKGEITRGAIINAFPFTNKVVTFSLPGQYFVEALEKCLTAHWVTNPFNGPWLPQISGLRVTLNTTSGKADSVLVKEDDEYLPIDSTKKYQITTSKFLFEGGNGFEATNTLRRMMLRSAELRGAKLFMFKEHGQNLISVGIDADILEKYIRKMTPITPSIDNRLTLLN